MALRGIGTYTSASASTTAVVPNSNVSGSTPQNGDVVLLLCCGGGGTGDFTDSGDGFSTIANFTLQSLGGVQFRMLGKIAGSSEPSSYTVTFSASNYIWAECRSYSGRLSTSLSSPNNYMQGGGQNVTSGSAMSIPTGLTASAGDDIVLMIGLGSAGSGYSGVSYSPPSGYANGIFAANNTSFVGALLGCDMVNASAGSIGTLGGTATFSGPTSPIGAPYVISLPQGSASTATLAWIV